MNINIRLRTDCHHLFENDKYTLLLNKNAEYLWFILVPNTEQEDLLDLDKSHRDELMDVCSKLSGYIKSNSTFTKTNFGAIGNVVSQMHLHIVGRSQNDPLFPAVVWGNTKTSKDYTTVQVESLRKDIEDLLK
ncbi:MAG: HIT family protein [Candidatus Zophobacter franzmannii]|nr:HIT family protein [Candidatus Zophobacter franzmannii]